MSKTEMARKLHDKGLTFAEIAELIGSSRGSVAGLVWRSRPENRERERDRLRERAAFMRKRFAHAVAAPAPNVGVGSADWWKARGF